MAMKISLD